MADSRINVILGAKDEASKTVTGLRGQMERFKKDAMTGFGLGAGIGVFNLATRAIGGVVDIFGDAVRAAAEEEAAIATLTQAIEANDEAWDGNIDAVEDLIQQRQALAFSDGEQRESLQLLVGATKDVTEAQKLLGTAMDFARFRGMELRAASDLLGKAYAGNFSTLSRYGIVVRKGAKATEVLAQVQKMAAGQAETYANTAAGATERANIALADALEDLGKVLTPLMTDFALWAAEVIPDVVRGIGDIGSAIGAVGAELNAMTAGIAADRSELEILATTYGISTDALIEMIVATRRSQRDVDALTAGIEVQNAAIAGGAGDFEDWVEHEAAAAREAAGLTEAVEEQTEASDEYTRAARAVVEMNARLAQAAGLAAAAQRGAGQTADEAAAAYDPLSSITTATALRFVALAKAEEKARTRLLAFRDAADDIAETRSLDKINDALRKQRHNLRLAAEAGNVRKFAAATAAIEQLKAERELRQQGHRALREYRRRTREQKTAQGEVTDSVEETTAALEALDRTDPTATVTADTSQANAKLDALHAKLAAMAGTTYTVTGSGVAGRLVPRAGGGPTSPHQTYLIGERGPELLHMGSQSGHITPNHKLGSSGQTVIVMDGRVVGELIDARLGRRSATLGRDGSYRSAV